MFEDIVNSVEVSRKGLVILYVIKTLNELSDMGILEGKAFELDEKAHELLKGLNTPPTDEEIQETLILLKSEGYIV